MLPDIDNYFLNKEEPVKSCLLAMRSFLLRGELTEAWKYSMPFYCLDGKMFCYLWVNKKTNEPYIGFVDGKFIDHPDLIADKRSRMKILMLDAKKDIPVKKIGGIIKTLIKLRKQRQELHKPQG
jgi:hypothetical protein